MKGWEMLVAAMRFTIHADTSQDNGSFIFVFHEDNSPVIVVYMPWACSIQEKTIAKEYKLVKNEIKVCEILYEWLNC